MKLAFCLFKYFPYGGLQRDFLRIAQACIAQGHEVHVYTMQWEGEREPELHLHLIKAKGWQNHTRCYTFTKKLKVELDQEQYDLVVGFNKMPYLDFYYAADVCYQSRMLQKRRRFLYWFLPRYQRWLALERAVFAKKSGTQIMLISARQQPEYMQCYQTDAARFHLLSPGIARDRVISSNASEIKQQMRTLYQVPKDHFILLMVGSGFRAKGLDRAIKALATLPQEMKARCHLWVVGQDHPDAFVRLAAKLRVKHQVKFLGGRPDVPHFLLAADLLIHPAYHENTGTVLLEAIVAGLPVLTVDVCGYAHYVLEAKAGVVLSSPFDQGKLNAVLPQMLLSSQLPIWSQNGAAFAHQADIYSLPEKARELIEKAICP